MSKSLKIIFLASLSLCLLHNINAQGKAGASIEQNFLHPPASAKPWVFWYWYHGVVSKAGITADLEAMKKVGIHGAYLMTIKDTSAAIPFQPQVRQLTQEWWAMVKFALQEAKRLGLKIGVHVSDGFALAGGPWITPEMSMQKLTWAKTYVAAGNKNKIILPQPDTNENFYKDIAVYAYPANYKNEIAVNKLKPVVTTSNGTNASFLPDIISAKQTFRSDSNCWIQYTYTQPVTVRQVKIRKQNNAYQSQRFIIQRSDDGINFIVIDTLHPPRQGWQDWNEPYTHGVKTFSSKYIRFVWQKEGTEPGSEDLDAAKWKPVLRVQGIYVSDEPIINNYEGKNGSVWRVAFNTTDEEVSKANAVPLKSIINLTDKLSANGKLNWLPPSNQNWVIVRIGHTSTGSTNATGGGGKGLECDKFNQATVALQFNNWFGKFYLQTNSSLAKEVVKLFHVDSWECGSQNWSSNFENEFKKRRGYDLIPYLLVMTGVPVTDAATSEKILHDVRQTIAELVNDIFYTTLKDLAHAKGCEFTAESVAPTFVSDGLMHYKNVDIPMGEFWRNSPTHDKPNDMLDAISAAHIYGKDIVQAEAFTTLRSDWGEHPGNLKVLGDRAFASGINRFALHVFMHNPWMNKKPGMTLDGIGLFYQRDQTWFQQSKAWIDYLTRCQALLQMGKPVVDIAVFTGEEVPRRSILPDRLVNTLPGIFGKEKVNAEKKRLENAGQSLEERPAGVIHSANMANPADWIDPLNGYAYDSFNPDAFMMMSVKNGRVILPGGANYGVLVFPGKHPMQPNHTLLSLATAKKLLQLVRAGAKIIMSKEYLNGIGLQDNNDSIKLVLHQLLNAGHKKGTIIFAPFTDSSFVKLGMQKDVEIVNNDHSIAWTHRKVEDADIYFLSNQKPVEQDIKFSFRIKNTMPEIFDAVNGTILKPSSWEYKNNSTNSLIHFEPNQSLIIVFRKKGIKSINGNRTKEREEIPFAGNWKILFDKNESGTTYTLDTLKSWTLFDNPSIKYYSGTAKYANRFVVKNKSDINVAKILFDSIFNIVTIKINGVDCGTLWTPPYELDITKALKSGENKIEIEVTNTWRNRLIGDELNPENKTTWYNSAFKLKNKPLLPAGLVGDVKIMFH
jgi:hypothetical protein